MFRRIFPLFLALIVCGAIGYSVDRYNAHLVVAEKTIKYKCGECGKVEEYAENSYHTHYCTGTSDKPHSKRIMDAVSD